MEIRSSEITSESMYLSRKDFIKGLGLVSASAALLAACGPSGSQSAPVDTSDLSVSSETDELGDPINPFEVVTNYNNFYEFTTDKERVAGLSQDFVTTPWEVAVGGLVNNPITLDIDMLKELGVEERIYRMRCVEGWSMVIPWNGIQLGKLLDMVEPTSAAKFVRFETAYLPGEMPGLKNPFYDWPYVEGLRLDEAYNELTLLATGIYGKDLLPQNGAPVRLVVPWKYGLKGIKSIVKIDLVEEMPVSLWMAAAPNEYGFYSNVNPMVDHPRWSQSTERRLGEIERRETLMFNGYSEQVAHLYEGMDLRVNF